MAGPTEDNSTPDPWVADVASLDAARHLWKMARAIDHSFLGHPSGGVPGDTPGGDGYPPGDAAVSAKLWGPGGSVDAPKASQDGAGVHPKEGGVMRRFENRRPELNIKKFWQVNEPRQGDGSAWYVTYSWGRIGSAGDEDTKKFISYVEATRFIAAKIKEKLGHGYDETTTSKGGVVNYASPEWTPAKKFEPGPPKVCTHETLRKHGGNLKCVVCGVILGATGFHQQLREIPEPKAAVLGDARHIELED